MPVTNKSFTKMMANALIADWLTPSIETTTLVLIPTHIHNTLTTDLLHSVSTLHRSKVRDRVKMLEVEVVPRRDTLGLTSGTWVNWGWYRNDWSMPSISLLILQKKSFFVLVSTLGSTEKSKSLLSIKRILTALRATTKIAIRSNCWAMGCM